MSKQPPSNPPVNDDDDEDYISEEDEDFNPNAAGARPAASSESEADDEEDGNEAHIAVQKKKTKPKSKQEPEAEDLGFENSGDEGIIKAGAKEARRKKRKRKDSTTAADNEDSGGEGGFVRTRSMRAAATDSSQPRKLLPPSASGPVTADIDALWARLSASSIIPLRSTDPSTQDQQPASASAPLSDPTQNLIPIQRTYTFAGKTHTERKLVPRSSAQAQAYLATAEQRAGANKENVNIDLAGLDAEKKLEIEIDAKQQEEAQEDTRQKPQKRGPDNQLLFRPLRRRSHWETNPSSTIRSLPPPLDAKAGVDPRLLFRRIDKAHLGRDAQLCFAASAGDATTTTATTAALDGDTSVGRVLPRIPGKALKAQRLNVVDKSKLDWAEHVDSQEGAREELEKARRDKGSYLERKDFLEKVEDLREGERRKARGVGVER